jgi:hypothetical protein
LVPEQDDPKSAVAPLQQAVRDREQACVVDLLALFRFRPNDYEADALPITGGRWGFDLFSQESLKRFGLNAGGGAAAGGLAGLTIDAMTGGLSLGAAAALGATIGAVWGSVRAHGQRLADVLRGYTELRIQDETLKLLALRQLELVQALLARGHASRDRVRLAAGVVAGRGRWAAEALPDELELARAHPEWSRLSAGDRALPATDLRRAAARDALKRRIVSELAADRRGNVAF